MNSDFRDLLCLFAEHGVRYLVVGGYAVIHYTEPRFTKDIDLWIEPSEENAGRVEMALAAFGTPLIEITRTDLAEEKTQFRIGLPPTCVDILTSVPGLIFRESWSRRETVDHEDGFSLFYVGKADLITAKEVAGRDQDVADLRKLRDTDPS